MISAPLPRNESERLEVLRSYGVLDTPPEERFDRVVRLVSEYLDVPTSLVSLVDADRQWFKAAHGLAATETGRDVAFCAHAILRDRTLIVENALNDERFADNPLVAEAPSIRFYAGTPLITPSGHRLGTLCAIDYEARQLPAQEELFLRDMAAIVMDELELSAAAAALEEHTKSLEERNQSLDAFVHTLSHDLAGPIRRIRSFCDLLQSDSAIPSEECIHYISKSALTADRLLVDLRAFFVVERAAETSEIDIREGLESALETLSEDIRQTSARIEVTGTLPRVRANPALIHSLFQNLVGNAIKYRSERPLVVGIHGEAQDGTWKISVQDNGMGIAPEHQERVFDLLYRLHSESKIPGSGMGLAICEKIVRRCGGTIQLDSVEGEGTCVSFTLPSSSDPSVAKAA